MLCWNCAHVYFHDAWNQLSKSSESRSKSVRATSTGACSASQLKGLRSPLFGCLCSLHLVHMRIVHKDTDGNRTLELIFRSVTQKRSGSASHSVRPASARGVEGWQVEANWEAGKSVTGKNKSTAVLLFRQFDSTQVVRYRPTLLLLCACWAQAKARRCRSFDVPSPPTWRAEHAVLRVGSPSSAKYDNFQSRLWLRLCCCRIVADLRADCNGGENAFVCEMDDEILTGGEPTPQTIIPHVWVFREQRWQDFIDAISVSQ